ncbi:hypothetical protein BDR07DRAFT_1540692, partial [Suillus spraguei]
MHSSTSIQMTTLRSIGNIVTGNDLWTQVIASGTLLALLSLLSFPKEGIRKEACWMVSKITARSPPQIQVAIDANIISPVINPNPTSSDLHEPVQIRFLISQGCF